jgi:hypothetical protein
MTTPYRWTFYRSGGVDQVSLSTGDDLAHLAELDPKLWVALSMPTRGVEIDPRTLDVLDSDKDGHIRQPEILAAVAWVCEVYKDPAKLFEGGDTIKLDALRDGPVRTAAERLLANLGTPDGKQVSLADATLGEKQFTDTRFNGDGVIHPECTEGELRAVIADVMTTHGSLLDRCGKLGIDKPRADAFLTECTAMVEWHAHADATVMPLGLATPAAADAVRAVRSKIDDYFTRCRLAAFDARAGAALNANDAELAALSNHELSADSPDVASLPIARIAANATLPLTTGVNPAWETRLATLGAAAVLPLLGARDALTEAAWRELVGRLAAYEAWLGTRPPNQLDALLIDRIRAIVAGTPAPGLDRLFEQDLAVKPEIDAVADVEKLCRYQRDLAKLLRNYVNFSEFYARKGAVFQAGTLYLDARGCTLVVEVIDPAKHGTMAPMAGAFLAYCDCVRPGEKKTIAAAFTQGEVDNLMVGRNGVFVDRAGHDWEASITKLIENPISIRQAFWAPYKKLVRMIEERVAKRAAAADADATGKLEHGAESVTAAPAPIPSAATPPAPAAPAAPAAPGAPAVPAAPAAPGALAAQAAHKFDVGTIAALGVAIGGIGAFATAIMATFFGLGWWMPLGLLGVLLAISGPSMLLAFIKLRRRNLGPLLDANGWAINAMTRINVPFGTALTDVAVLPAGAKRMARDPYAERERPWRLYIVIVCVFAVAIAWYVGRLDHYLPHALRSTSVLGDAAPAKAEADAPVPPVVVPAAAPAKK